MDSSSFEENENEVVVSIVNIESDLDKTADEANFDLAPKDILIDQKIFTTARWEVKRNDGGIILVFTDIKITAMQIRNSEGELRTDVRGSFRHYNSTQNNQGRHSASLKIALLGGARNELAVPFPDIWIQRDACYDRGVTSLPQTRLSTDIFRSIVYCSHLFHATWTYEGAC